jgi:hypothetical protein
MDKPFEGTGLWRVGCFKCGSNTHKGIACRYAEEAFEYARKLRIRQEGAQANEDSVRYRPIRVRLSQSSLPPTQRSSPPPAHRRGSYLPSTQRSSPPPAHRHGSSVPRTRRDDIAKSTNWRARSSGPLDKAQAPRQSLGKNTSSIKGVRFDNKVSIIDDDDSGNDEFTGLLRERRYGQDSGFDEFAGLSWERRRKMTLPPAPQQSRSGYTRTLPTLTPATGPLDRAAVAPKRSSGKTTLPTGSMSVNDAEHVASNVAYEADSDSEIEGFDGFTGLSWERHRSDSGPGFRVLDSSSSSDRSRTPLVLAPKQSHLALLTVVPLSDEIVPFAPGQSRFICDAVYDTDSDSEVEGFDGLTGVSCERPSKITTLATSGFGSGSGTGTGSDSGSGSNSSSGSGFDSSYTHTLLAPSQSDTIAPFTPPVQMINQARTTDQRKLANLKQDEFQDRERASILSRSIFKHFLSLTSLVLKAREE